MANLIGTVALIFLQWLVIRPCIEWATFHEILVVESDASTPEPGELIINEIHYAPTSSQLEFVELLNRSNQKINICTVAFSDSRDAFVDICKGLYEVLPDSLVIVARDSVALRLAFPHISDTIFSPESWPVLNNGGDIARIASADMLIDEVAYDPSWGGQGVSLEKIDPAGPAAASNWQSSAHPSGATPGVQNSIYAPDLLPPIILLAEVLNTDEVILVWDEPIDLTTIDPSDFTIDGASPQSLSIISTTQFRLAFGFKIQEATLTYAHITDLTGNETSQTSQMLAYVPHTGNLLINEIMYAPLADAFDRLPDQPEYIELYNNAGRPLSLRDISLVGLPDELNHADTLISGVLHPVVLPSSYTVMYAAAESNAAGENLQAAFPAIDVRAESITLLPIPSSSLSLLNTGDRIAIISQGNEVIDEVVYSPNWHHPVLKETKGISLERRSLMATTNTPTNWSSSVDLNGGTPGRSNSIQVNPSDKPMQSTLELNPEVFSPDGDGFEDVLQIEYTSENASDVVGIKVFDLDGRLVKTVAQSKIVRQQEILFWEGHDNDGYQLPVGIYIVFVEVLDLFNGQTHVLKKPVVLALPLN